MAGLSLLVRLGLRGGGRRLVALLPVWHLFRGDGRLLTCTGGVGGIEAGHGGGGGHAGGRRRPRRRQRTGRIARHATVEDLGKVGGSLQDEFLQN